MCINKDELSNRVAEIRNLKVMKEELDNQLKSLEFDVIKRQNRVSISVQTSK